MFKFRVPVPSRAMVVAVVAVIIAAAGTTSAYGAAKNFLLNVSNTSSTSTTLNGSAIAGKALQITNTNTASGATALSLSVASGHAPFTVNRSTKITNLNADQLDGLDSSALQRRVTGTCAADSAVKSVAADGSVSCAAFPHASITTIGHAIGPFGTFPAADDLGSFTTAGGTFLLSFSASASSATAPNEIGAILFICSSTPCDAGTPGALAADTASFYTTEAHSERTLVSQWNYVGLSAGTYYVNVVPVAGTTMDSASEAAWLGLQL
jgi:hypothetical protein